MAACASVIGIALGSCLVEAFGWGDGLLTGVAEVSGCRGRPGPTSTILGRVVGWLHCAGLVFGLRCYIWAVFGRRGYLWDGCCRYLVDCREACIVWTVR